MNLNSSGFSTEIVGVEIPPLWKHPIVEGINCSAMFDGDASYIKENSVNRISLEQLPCKDIRSRGFYAKEPLSKTGADFPLAYIPNIYRDYISIERSFLISYAPQNYYLQLTKKQTPAFNLECLL
uniref:Uncharacterized protein n=1 Tax=Rhabditophanes sp. KR3021 TaxID=114890 RepID=A0AC35TIS0_9BILA